MLFWLFFTKVISPNARILPNCIMFDRIIENRNCLIHYSLQQTFDGKHALNIFTHNVNPLSVWELYLRPNFLYLLPKGVA